MKVMNLLTSGGVGGIEILCRDIAQKSKIQNCFCFLFGEGMIYDQMKSSGIEVYSFGTKKISIDRFKRLKKIAKFCDIIVVHHDDPFLQMYYLALMRYYPHKKYISMVHHCYDPVADNLGYGLVKRIIKKSLISTLIKKSDKLIFVSKAGYKSYADSFEINIENAEIVYNGISENKLNDSERTVKNPTEVVRLAYVGRLVKLKGVEKLIDILPRLINEYDFHLDVVGDGNCRNEIEDRVLRYGLKNVVTFYGFQENVDPYLERANIFIYPSITEIFGLSLVEAMAYKCICVASNVGGIPEIVNDGFNGFLNVDNSVDGLYEAVSKAMLVLQNDEKCKIMMDHARKTAEKFTISSTVKELESVYKSVLGEN